ncbi:MAG: hypothetical protein IIA61_04130 [Candidatus Marinimicrobia bacterium]|nr:hypothetical protein [Candidatus Neomarinimicrobiota bacterium]
MSWLKHAFAVDPPGPATPTEPQKEVVDMICTEIARRHLTTPAIATLEMFRPMNYLGSQAMHFFQPIVSAILTGEGYRHFTEFLEQRGSIDYFCKRIEEFEERYAHRKEKQSAHKNEELKEKGIFRYKE